MDFRFLRVKIFETWWVTPVPKQAIFFRLAYICFDCTRYSLSDLYPGHYRSSGFHTEARCFWSSFCFRLQAKRRSDMNCWNKPVWITGLAHPKGSTRLRPTFHNCFIYLFYFYIKTLWHNVRYYPDIRLERLSETTKYLSQDSRSPGWDFNPGPPEEVEETLFSQPRSVVFGLSYKSNVLDSAGTQALTMTNLHQKNSEFKEI
jgi:hypothetical protein